MDSREKRTPMAGADRRRQIRRRGLVLVAVALAALCLWLVRPQERLLLRVAHPVMTVAPTQFAMSYAEYEATCWLSDHQLLTVDPIYTPDFRRDPQGAPLQKSWHGSADLLDTTTHTRTHLTALTDLIARTTPRPTWRPDRFQISPGGTWLLWQTYSGSDSWPLPHAAHLDGSGYREWGRNRSEKDVFLDDGHLVQIEPDEAVTVRDLSAPNRDLDLAHPPQIEALLAQYAARQPVFVTAAPSNGTGSMAEIRTYRSQDLRALFLRRFNGNRKAPEPIEVREVKLPEGMMIQQAEVSPQQQATVYLIRTSRTPWLPAQLHRIFPKLVSRPVLTEDLWISRADGQGMREIGHVPNEEDQSDIEHIFLDLKWLPDGKQVSFIYHGTLYVVPADPGR